MCSMFQEASSFNQPLNDWDVSKRDNYGCFVCFVEQVDFNQPLNNWNVSNVTTMRVVCFGKQVLSINLSMIGMCQT